MQTLALIEAAKTPPYHVKGNRRPEIKRIPWREVWNTIHMAEVRGSHDIADVFLKSLIAEALFDDEGMWCWKDESDDDATCHRVTFH